MKTEHIILLAIVGYFVYKHAAGSYPGAGATHQVYCDAPGADPVMCQWLAAHPGTDTDPGAMVP